MPLNFFILYRKRIRRYVFTMTSRTTKRRNGTIGIKYCGGCNPLIDRQGLVRDIEKLLPPNLRLATDITPSPWKIGILVCGCPIACADRANIRGISKRWIRVGGASVDLDSMEIGEMASSIVRKICMLLAER